MKLSNSGKAMHTPYGMISHGASVMDDKKWALCKEMPSVAQALKAGSLKAEGESVKAEPVKEQPKQEEKPKAVESESDK